MVVLRGPRTPWPRTWIVALIVLAVVLAPVADIAAQSDETTGSDAPATEAPLESDAPVSETAIAEAPIDPTPAGDAPADANDETGVPAEWFVDVTAAATDAEGGSADEGSVTDEEIPSDPVSEGDGTTDEVDWEPEPEPEPGIGDGTDAFFDPDNAAAGYEAFAQTQVVTVVLAEVAGSGVVGTATLTENGATTIVRLELAGAVGDLTAGIFTGACASDRHTEAFGLEPPDETGRGETDVPTALVELLVGEYSVIVYRAVGTSGQLQVACGDTLPVSATSDGAETEGEASPPAGGDISSTGIGTMASAGGAGALLAGLAVLAFFLALGGAALRRTAPGA